MKKWKFIVPICILVIVSLIFVFLYMDFYRQTKESENIEPDYTEQFDDRANVEVQIEPVNVSKGTVNFNELENDAMLFAKVEEIKSILAYEPGQNVKMSQIEKVAGAKLDSLFDNHTLRMTGSVTTNGKNKGYCIVTQKKDGMAPNIYVIVTPDTLTQKVTQAVATEVTSSEISDITLQCFFNHSVRNSNEEETEASRYFYEAVFEHDGMNYYVSFDFSGYNRELKVVPTTKEESSKEFAEFLERFVELLVKE